MNHATGKTEAIGVDAVFFLVCRSLLIPFLGRPAALLAVRPRNLADALNAEAFDARRITPLAKPASELPNFVLPHALILNCLGLFVKPSDDRIGLRLGYASRRAGASRPACRTLAKTGDATREVVMRPASGKPFDRELFVLKLRAPSRRMQTETRARWLKASAERRKLGQGDGEGLLVARTHSALDVLRDYLKDVDRICREVWQTQGNEITPGFVRGKLRVEVCNAIEARAAALRGEISLFVRRKNLHSSATAGLHLAQAVSLLKDEIYTQCEVEARELEYRNKPTKFVAREEEKEPPRLSKPTNSVAIAKLRIGQNIDKLRRECGWSFDQLAEKTGIDKKATLSHRHGKHKPNPRTLKVYAQAFSKELNRPITANNLEE
jgi:hypothetical protein